MEVQLTNFLQYIHKKQNLLFEEMFKFRPQYQSNRFHRHTLIVKTSLCHEEKHYNFHKRGSKDFSIKAYEIPLQKKLQLFAYQETKQTKYQDKETQILICLSKMPTQDQKYQMLFSLLIEEKDNYKKFVVKVQHPTKEERNEQQQPFSTLYSNRKIDQGPFLVVRSFEKMVLSKGMRIKFGKYLWVVKYLKNVKDVDLQFGKNFPHDETLPIENQITAKAKTTQNEENKCVICFSTQNSQDDPLLNLCVCKGSCQWTHLSCLQRFIQLKTKQREQSNLLGVPFKCPNCKETFPEFFTIDGIKYIRLLGKSNEKPFICLAPRYLGHQNVRKLDLKQNARFHIGSSSESDIRIPLIDETNSSIEYDGEKTFLLDEKSQYGTSIAYENMQFDLNKKDQRIIQVQNALFMLSVRVNKLG